jgi:Ca2+-binding RTX toxin-like protein
VYGFVVEKFNNATGRTLSTSNFGDENYYKKFLLDTNNDGKDDLVYIYSGPSGIYTYTSISNGDGTFGNLIGGQKVSGSFGSIDSYQKMITDLNGDGLKDIVLAYSGSYGATVYSSLNLGQDFTVNTIFGDSGNDTLIGADGNDIINGGVGNDQLTGGLGYDVLIGGAGNDQFIFKDLLDSTASESDLILDFIKGEDKINLSNLGFDSIAEGQGKNSSAHGIEYYFEDETQY